MKKMQMGLGGFVEREGKKGSVYMKTGYMVGTSYGW